jgi:hypothetical protein
MKNLHVDVSQSLSMKLHLFHDLELAEREEEKGTKERNKNNKIIIFYS